MGTGGVAFAVTDQLTDPKSSGFIGLGFVTQPTGLFALSRQAQGVPARLSATRHKTRFGFRQKAAIRRNGSSASNSR